MADSITIARPYAKAIFEHASALQKQSEWSYYLHVLASSVLDSNAQDFINNPATTVKQHTKLLTSVITDITKSEANNDLNHLINFVEILAENKRILVLPDIMMLFEAMRAEQEKTLSVTVISYSLLSEAQQQDLIHSLSKRLQRQVTLNVMIDKEIIGGAVIYAGDLVIDGSVRSKLAKLRTVLAV